jgi:hypothetical protein
VNDATFAKVQKAASAQERSISAWLQAIIERELNGSDL